MVSGSATLAIGKNISGYPMFGRPEIRQIQFLVHPKSGLLDQDQLPRTGTGHTIPRVPVPSDSLPVRSYRFLPKMYSTITVPVYYIYEDNQIRPS